MIIRDENYFTDKYELTRTHSEVLEAVKVVKPRKTLDLGCGNGRNSLYLAANGYDVDAWDKNAMSIANDERIKSIENLDNLHTRVVDLNNLTFDRQYDFILSTVVLMFLEAKTIPGLIANDMEKQGILKTIAMLMIIAVIIRLVMLSGIL